MVGGQFGDNVLRERIYLFLLGSSEPDRWQSLHRASMVPQCIYGVL